MSIAPARPRAPIGPSRAVTCARARCVRAHATLSQAHGRWQVADSAEEHCTLNFMQYSRIPRPHLRWTAAETPHTCARTRPHLREDSPTAPGLCRYSQIPGLNLFDTKGAPPIKKSHTQICTGIGATPPTSAPELAHPCRICTGTRLAHSTSAPGLGSPHPMLMSALGLGSLLATSAPGLGSPFRKKNTPTWTPSITTTMAILLSSPMHRVHACAEQCVRICAGQECAAGVLFARVHAPIPFCCVL